jgi:hypothetical protein
MCPISGLSDIRRLPRIAKIRLGIKVQGKESEYPQRVDWYVCPDNVKAAYGEQPTTLPIMFPSSDPEVIAPQYYKCYRRTYGLVCLSEDTEILTARGWLGIDQLRGDDLVVTLDTSSGNYVEQVVQKKFILDGPGTMYNFKTKSLDALLTEDHRIVYHTKKSLRWRNVAAKDAPCPMSWPACGAVQKTDIDITDDVLRLLAWVITEGTWAKPSWTKNHNMPLSPKNRLTAEERAKRASYITIFQSHPVNVLEIRTLLTRLFGCANESPVTNSGGPQNRKAIVLPRSNFFLGKTASDLCRFYLGDNLHRIPRQILANASPRQLEVLFETLNKGDASIDIPHGTRFYPGKNLGLADDFQELCTRLGMRSSTNNGSRHPSTVGQVLVQVGSKWKTSHTIKRRPTIVPYQGRVWCITVQNGTFVARRKGRVFTTGNCKGDGETCRAKLDTATGTLADRNTIDWKYEQMTCQGEECPEFQEGNCKRVMSLLFVLFELPGLGVYQLDTSNRSSIINTNSFIYMLNSMTRGRFAMVPLKMSLLKEERQTPKGKQNISCLVFNKDDIRPMDLVKGIAGQNLLVEAADEEEPPDDLYPPKVLESADKRASEVIPGSQLVVAQSGSPAGAPPAGAGATPPAGDKKTTRKTRANKPPAGPPSSGNAPLISPELIEAWKKLRDLQQETSVSDAMMRGGFRQANPQVTIPKSALSDTPPPSVTMPMIKSMHARLEKYKDSLQTVKEFTDAHVADKAHPQVQSENKPPVTSAVTETHTVVTPGPGQEVLDI